MRTTVTLDADTELIVRRRMKEQKVSFKQALNDAIRDGMAGRPVERFVTETARMGRPAINLDRALQIAAEIEDAELVVRMKSGS